MQRQSNISVAVEPSLWPAQSNYLIFTLKTEICDISLVRLALDFVCVLHLSILGRKKYHSWSSEMKMFLPRVAIIAND